MKKRKPAPVKFSKMSLAELRSATGDLEREMVAETFRTLEPAERARWEKARRKPGRPRRSEGAKVISVSVERRLLVRSDALARNLGITRASLVERGLMAVLAAEGRLLPTPITLSGEARFSRLCAHPDLEPQRG